MSLLLDALKKSGKTASQSSDLSEMRRLEGAPVAAAYQSGPSKTSSIRATGENLFAAKSAPDKKRPRLGMVPIIFIAGGLFAAAGGYYLYLEIAANNQRTFHAEASPSAQPVAAHNPIAIQQASVALVPVQLPLEPSRKIGVPVAETKKIAPRSAKASKATQEALSIQHGPEANSIDPILASAYESYQQGDYATAWQRYREALALAPDNRDALLGLAVIAQQQGKNAAAVHYYRQVLLLDPRDPIAHAGLSSFGSGDSASKESRLKQLISQQPDSAALYFALGHQYVAQSRWSDAQQAYFNALAMEPDNALFAFSLAISLDHLGQRKAAAQYYQQALKLDTAGHARFNFALAQQRLNELTAPGN